MKTICIISCAAFGLFLGAPQSKADACGSMLGNLVTNCGFESGFAAWIVTGNDVPGQQDTLYGVEGTDPLDGIMPHSGSNQVFIADLDSNPTTLSQTISTVIGQQYTVSLYVAQDTTPLTSHCGAPLCSNELSVVFGGATLDSFTAVPVEAYKLYTFNTKATSTSSALSLTFGNDLGEFLVDDVSVVATPEPSAWAFMLTAAAGCVFLLRRKLRPVPGV